MERKSILFYLTIFLLIFLFATAATYFDFDLWARLIAGMGVIDGGQVLKEDFLSYTPVHTWFDHEWGSGVIFYACLKLFGPYSLILLHALLIFGTFFIASHVVKMRYKNPYNILFYFFAFFALQEIWKAPVRCHLFSFLFFTLFIYLLEKVRRGNNKLLYLIPPIILLWNNIHGGVVSGIGLLIMYGVGEFLNKKPYLKYFYTFIASSIALIINPWGFDYIKFLLMANTMERKYITEWWSIFSQQYIYRWIEFKIYMFACIICESISIFKKIKLNTIKEFYEKADKTKYIVLLSTLYLAISHTKLVPFFVITSLCFVYEDFYELIKNLKFPQWKDKALYTLILSLSIINFLIKDFSLPVGAHIYPIQEIEFIKQNKLQGKLLTDFGYGSYASYKLYPHNLIFMDGRYEEVYYDYMVPMLKALHLVEGQWDAALTYFKPDVMIIKKSYPIFEKLKTENDWTLVYDGHLFGVFLPKDKSNREFILPSNDINYYKKTLFDTDIDIRSIIKK